MSDSFIIEQCAPTLAGIKTGSLFTSPYENREAVVRRIRDINRQLVPKGLCMIPLRYSEKRVLLYLYRPEKLRQDLCNVHAAGILRGAGYDSENSERCIMRLIERLGGGGEFPHEIGLFLSYPPEDVEGFIKNKASGFKCFGAWKVYGDEEKAKETFSKYKKCTNIYCRLCEAGLGIGQLAAAV